MFHVGAREYDPRTARWLQRDPIGVGGGHANVYLYCGNEPVNAKDPSGLDPGDRYKTADGAAKAALNDVWAKTQKTDLEHGGLILKLPDGTFTYSHPYVGDSGYIPQLSSRNIPAVLPSGEIVVATYHVHPAGQPNSEQFSLVDIDHCYRSNAKSNAHDRAYLATASGRILRLQPDYRWVPDDRGGRTAGRDEKIELIGYVKGQKPLSNRVFRSIIKRISIFFERSGQGICEAYRNGYRP